MDTKALEEHVFIVLGLAIKHLSLAFLLRSDGYGAVDIRS
jgi:hypothetical protein